VAARHNRRARRRTNRTLVEHSVSGVAPGASGVGCGCDARATNRFARDRLGGENAAASSRSDRTQIAEARSRRIVSSSRNLPSSPLARVTSAQRGRQRRRRRRPRGGDDDCVCASSTARRSCRSTFSARTRRERIVVLLFKITIVMM
jgi:hypothetical protein